MDFMEGTMIRVNQLLQIKNGGFLAFMRSKDRGSDGERYVDLGWRRRMALDETDYLLLYWDNKLSFEELKKLKFEEQEDGKKLLKLLPFLKARKVGYTCVSGGCEEGLYRIGPMPAWWSGIHFDEAIACRNGFAYQKHSWFDGDTYVLNVWYANKRLKVEGKEICYWEINWTTRNLWKEEVLKWIKESFEKEQSLSREDFYGLFDQWGLGDLRNWTFFWSWDGKSYRSHDDWTE